MNKPMNAEQKALFQAIEASIAYHKLADVPYVMLSYAQTLNGSIAITNTSPLALSCQESLLFTHHLRSLSDAILVGIGTVLSDDPKLTTRLTEGDSPRAIVLDSKLRTPTNAALLCQAHQKPWVVTAPGSSSADKKRLCAAGAEVIEIPCMANGKLDIHKLLLQLAAEGIRVLMVEGGQQVISDFLYREIVNEMLVTITPNIISGLNAVESKYPLKKKMFQISGQVRFGSDLVVRLCRRTSDED